MKYVQRTSYNIKNNFIENLIKDRGIIKNDSELQLYLKPDSSVENNPISLDNMQEGFNLLMKHRDDKILIIADSDVDGFCSAAIAYNYFDYLRKKFGYKMELDYLLPEAKEHGLQTKVDYLMTEKKADLLFIPDSSSNDHNEIKALHDFGYDILIEDHHIFDYYDKNAVVINSQGGDYSNRELCGGGVVYKFIEYCDEYLGCNYAPNLLDLAATAIVGDMMNTNTLENRYLVTEGLKSFKNAGLRGLIRQQAFSLFSKKVEEITEEFLDNCSLSQIQVAFYIVPLINALIRIGSDSEKEIMFKALISGEELVDSTKRGHKGEKETIAEQAARACSNIRNRQNKEKDRAIELLDIQIIENCLDDNKILILNADDLDTPNTLTGLIAMGVSAKYKKPVLLGRINNNGDFKGSIRGRGETELKDFRQLLLDSDLMEYVEGHANAAGFSLKEKNIDRLYQYANEKLKNIDFHQGIYEIDFRLNGNSPYLRELIFEIDKYMNIFGQGNDEPMILVESIPTQNFRLVGADKNTVNIGFNGIKYVKFKDDDLANALKSNSKSTINIIGRASINEWNGNRTPQIMITDWEFCDDKLNDF